MLLSLNLGCRDPIKIKMSIPVCCRLPGTFMFSAPGQRFKAFYAGNPSKNS